MPKTPENMPPIITCLVVDDIDETIAFYEKAFGFKKSFSVAGPDGKAVHGEVRHGGGAVMFGRPDEKTGCRLPTPEGGSHSLYAYVDDVDATFKQAVEAGCKEHTRPADMFWGDRIATLTDPFGHRWTLAQFVRKVSEEEIQEAMKQHQPA